MRSDQHSQTRFSVSVLVVGVTMGFVLAACGGSSKKDKERLEGDRIAVLTYEQQLQPDPRVQDNLVTLPNPVANPAWPQNGGYPSHAMQHLALGEAPTKIWSRSIGDGSGGRKQLTTPPVAADGFIFAIDVDAKVTALNAATGSVAWSRQIKVEKQSNSPSFGGGVGYAAGKVFAATGYGIAAAFDAQSGQELWRVNIGVPLRGAPAVVDNRVFYNTFDNQLFALNAADGVELWNHSGIIESAGLLGVSTPAVASGVVVAGFSSGELFALAVENGRVAWSDTLTRTGRMTPLSTLADIDGNPVIDRGMVFAVSHAGRMVAIDLRTGERLWERNLGSVHTPWVAGDFIYAVTMDNEVVCLTRREGHVQWVTQLQRYKDQKDRKGRVFWGGPVLAGDRLVVTSTNGYALSLSPYNGHILSGIKLSDKAFLAPIVANETLYVLTDDGDVTAYK